MLATPQSSDPVLNPNIYLNYFPPDVAKQFEFSRNLFLVTLGVSINPYPYQFARESLTHFILPQALLSDMLISLPQEFSLVMKSGVRPMMVAYWLSRYADFNQSICNLNRRNNRSSTLAFVLSCVIVKSEL